MVDGMEKKRLPTKNTLGNEQFTGSNRAFLKLSWDLIWLSIMGFILYHIIVNPYKATFSGIDLIIATMIVIVLAIAFPIVFSFHDLTCFHSIVLSKDRIVLKNIFGQSKNIEYTNIFSVNSFSEVSHPYMYGLSKVDIIRIDYGKTGSNVAKMLCSSLNEKQIRELVSLIKINLRKS